jgi:hypothetical protein
MRAIIEPVAAPEPDAPKPPLGRRLMWFVGLALASMLATGVVAYGLRAALFLR